MWFDEAIDAALAEADAAGRRRRLRAVAIPGPRLVLADGRSLIDVSSNDYLGLSQHPALKARATEWVGRFGAGARAARLVTGTLEAMLELEARLAAFKGTEAALIFNAGYQANAAVLPSLFDLAGGRNALVFTDRLNHASLHAGCAAAGVKEIRFRHNDLAHLEELLAQHAQGRPCFIVTESVFSMDGDRADVGALHAVAARHDGLLYLDEAHATGVLGPQGRGLGGDAPGAVIMGTLGKAFGSAGAYIAGSRRLIDYLVSRCAGFIYSTAPAPAAC
ncbi:MAG TPA: aminotransferase class I/II-fold pyridoxal phosphate-dependent enzyme, partial [Rhodocyclaceae bacterium]